MHNTSITPHSQQLLSILWRNPVNLFAITALTGLVIAYASGALSQSQLSFFNQHFADFTFLALIIFSTIRQLKKSVSIVDPIYWILLGSAFAAWFVLTILRITIFTSLSLSTIDLITNLSYFLYYSLMIAAIEVKSYEKAGQLLSKQSMLIWVSTFVFTLGAFIVLVLTAAKGTEHQENIFHASFIFYILMDCYLTIRWLHLAWTCREKHWIGYFLIGLGAFSFGIADLIEGLNLADFINTPVGSWIDWLWYIPYLFIYMALQIRVATSFEQNVSRSFSRSHLFNSPLFYTLISFFLFELFNSKPDYFLPLNGTQDLVMKLWLLINLALAVLHLSLMIKNQRSRNRQLKEAILENNAMQQRMLQQAQELESQSASNKAILDTTNNAIFTLNLHGQILSCNPAACQLLGYQHEQLMGAIFIEILQAEGELVRFFSYQSYRQKLSTQVGGIEIETQVIRADNSPVQVHVTLSQEKNNNEGLLVVSLVNISEQKNAEREAHQLKDQFTANISHEFRTPLTIINGVLENLLNQEKYNEDKEQLKTAKRNGLRMVRMVEQLLELSRIANDSVPLSTLNAQPIAYFVCSSFEEIAKSNQIELNYQLDNAAWITGNAQAFEKILFNLLSNAFKYTKKGAVEVILVNQEDSVKLSVRDTGIGIKKEQQGLIFERFHRVENDETKTVHGVGIGLALVKELCDTMMWELRIESAPGHGSLFELSIPKANPHEIPNEIVSDILQIDDKQNTLTKSIESEVIDAQSVSSHSAAKKSEYSVLIVEDNSDMQAHIKDILSPYHQCLLADNGEEGVRLAIDYVPDIIVSDVMMPGISGFELLKSLKKTEMTTHIPIILLTARSDSASKIRGLAAQADDYLSKPFDAQELLLRVNNQLNSREKLQQKLAKRLHQSAEGKSEDPVIEDKFVVKLEQIFTDNYKNTEFSMLDLANYLAMSDRQVQRKIKAVLGVSPLEALKHFRLIEAKKQLEAGDPIGVVAQTCGFSSQSYFGRCFKEKYKMTPKMFKQSVK
jgi:PAS domain S-box-containing protein